MKIQITQIGSVTVRSQISPATKKRFFSIGILKDGRWEVIRSTESIPFHYRNHKKALECASLLRQSRAEAFKAVIK